MTEEMEALQKNGKSFHLMQMGIRINNIKEGSELPFTPKQKYCLSGHRSGVNNLSFHHNYSLLASVSEDGTVKLWDYEQGTFERTLKGHTGNVTGVAFDSSGRYLASCSSVF